MSWSHLTDWWLKEITDDPSYETLVTPLLWEVFAPISKNVYLDLGCGEGRVIGAANDRGATVIGLDVNFSFLRRVDIAAMARLPSIPVRDSSVDGAYSVLTFEHLADHEGFFRECSRVIKPGGMLAMVINHPIWTAPGSTPITDSDGEVLWRPGEYFTRRHVDFPAAEFTIRFYHRPLEVILSAAANQEWNLTKLIERPHPDLTVQPAIPRLLAACWKRA